MMDTEEAERVLDALGLPTCQECGAAYDPGGEPSAYYPMPYDYEHGAATYCLGCWLGCGPVSMMEAEDAEKRCAEWFKQNRKAPSP